MSGRRVAPPIFCQLPHDGGPAKIPGILGSCAHSCHSPRKNHNIHQPPICTLPHISWELYVEWPFAADPSDLALPGQIPTAWNPTEQA